ncbi:hypothetical protein ACFW04_010973 [Cataglyphis niger]
MFFEVQECRRFRSSTEKTLSRRLFIRLFLLSAILKLLLILLY